MAVQKIIRVDEPAKNDRRYRGGLYRIWFAGPDDTEYSSDIFKSKYNRLMFEQDMIQRGISEADIEKYKELLNTEILEEEYCNPNYCPNCGM